MSRGRTAALAAGALALFLASWSLLHHGALGRGQVTDIPVYQRYANAVRHGKVPYRDFRLEYPPGALPVILLPSLRMRSDRDWFGLQHWLDREMAIAGCLTLLGSVLCLRELGAGTKRTAAALGLAALSPLLLGSVVLTRFDFWPTALAALALAALFRRRLEVAAILLACAIGTKLWPAVLLPPVLVWIARTYGRRAAAQWAAIVAALLAAVYVPFAVMSASGVGHSFHAQLGRPLQIESLGSSVLLAAHHLFGATVRVTSGFGSRNVHGPGSGAVELATTLAGAVALVAVWLLFARGPATLQRLATSCAASVAALLAFGKVFSPQFMIWLVPFVVLAAGTRGLAAGALLAAGLVLTQSWFPRHYFALANHLAAAQSAEVLARNLVVLALAVVLAWPRTEPAPVRVPAAPR